MRLRFRILIALVHFFTQTNYRTSNNVTLLESSTLEPSIHDVETEGMTTEKLVNYVRLKGKKGLMRLYGILRSEDYEGTYVAARYRQNMHKNRYTYWPKKCRYVRLCRLLVRRFIKCSSVLC